MTWEEIIIEIRNKPEFSDLVKYAYFEEDLQLNLQRFMESDEYKETLKLLNKFKKGSDSSILDIGAGNGISSIAFALAGFKVTVVEPDKSGTIGAGAIRKLADFNNLKNLKVIESFAESMPFEGNSFDFVYVRQAMHHANNLSLFLKEIARVLKPEGTLITIRDHVVNDEKQKEIFLKEHPLHKFYGGENAFSLSEYRAAITNSNLSIIQELGPLDSPINYFPLNRKNAWRLPLPQFLFKSYLKLLKMRTNNKYDDSGRLYSFIAKK